MILNPNSTLQVRPDLMFTANSYESDDTTFIADLVLARTPTSMKIDYYNKLEVESLAGLPDANRAESGEFNRMTRKHSQDSYGTMEFGLEEAVDLQDEATYGAVIAGEAESTAFTVQQMKRVREYRTIQKILNETTFPAAGTTGKTVGTVWDNAAAKPAEDITSCAEEIRKRTGIAREKLSLIVSPYTLARLAQVDHVRDSLRVYTREIDNEINREMAARYFGVKQVLCGDMTYNTANDGLTPVLSDGWSKTYAFLFYPMAPGLTPKSKKPGLGTTFTWTFGGSDYLVETYIEDKTSKRVVRVREWTDEKIVNTAFGQLLKSVG